MDDFEKFYKASINFLSFRQRSEKEMTDYLKKKKCDELTSKRIIDSLKRDKFINDEEFARMWIQSRVSIKPKAWRIIKMELKQKGISDEIIESFEEQTSENQDENSAMLLAQKKLRTIHDTDKFKIREKLGRYLAGRGFDWDTIKEVINRTLE